MIYYKIKCKYTVTEEADEAKLMRFWRKADSSYVGGQIFRVIILDRDETTIDAILMFSVSDYSLSSIKKRVISEFDETGETIKSINFSKTPEEITVTEAISLIRCRTIDGAGGNAYRCSKRVATRWCNAEYLNDNFDLKFDEFVLPHKQLSFSKAKDEARGILADESFYEELERIYSPLNKRKFCGNPVNYLINAASRETSKNLVKLLTKALYSNKRLLSTRVAYVTELGDVSYDKAIKNLCENSYASVVVIECSDSNIKDDRFARGHERLSEDIYDILKEYSLQTAFILVDLGSKACKQAVGELIVKEDISFIEISEGKGDNSTGKKYLKTLLKENKVRYVKEDFVIPEQEVYSVNDIVTAYRNIKKNRIRNSLYKSYKEIKPLKIDAPVAVSNSYEKLHSMVGLTEIKSIIDQIVSSQKINKLRVEMGLDVTNKFVECGRQDLVGRYVGWTAKQVEEQFRQAMGGILFIDEAYSLVEREGLYGDEAINTIVQMMENYRDTVIVIFAGYPDKMERFLEKNEGLRSRIAFHIDFPDYNADELCDILKLMSKNKGFTLDGEAEEKCRRIFDEACKNAEFGNGRFVRNLLEQAIIKQSSRLVKEYSNTKIDKSIVSLLSADDFDINAAKVYKTEKIAIGF